MPPLDLSGLSLAEAEDRVRAWLEQHAVAATETFPPHMRDDALSANSEAVEIAMRQVRRMLRHLTHQ